MLSWRGCGRAMAAAVALSGLASAGHGQILSNGAGAGPGESLPTSPPQGQVSTGSKSLDILLDARVPSAQAASAPQGGGAIGNGMPEILRGPEALSKAEQQGFKDALLREAVNTAELEARRQEREAQLRPQREEQSRRMSVTADASPDGGSEAEPGEARMTNGFILFLRENRYWILVIALATALLVWIKSSRMDARRGQLPGPAPRSAPASKRRSHKHRSRSRH